MLCVLQKQKEREVIALMNLKYALTTSPLPKWSLAECYPFTVGWQMLRQGVWSAKQPHIK